MIKIKPLAASIALINAGLIMPAMAQETSSQEEPLLLEEIVVTGIRGSLQKAMDIKRDARGVVDAIAAEDLGKMPDNNLAESLQRIPGVSIDRRNNEGNQVSVRGFGPSFNMVLLNGRQQPAASSPKQENASSKDQSRAFNFAEIAAESVSGVDIYKTSRPEMTTGGIGATINIKTAKPFDYEGTKTAFTVKASSDTSNEDGDDTTPEASGLFSTTFADGKFGILVNASYSERHSSEDLVTTDGWVRRDIAGANVNADFSGVDGDTWWMARNIVVDEAHHERERTNGMVVLQFAPNDNITTTLDWRMSDYEDEIVRHQTAGWFDNWSQLSGDVDSNGTLYNPSVTADPASFIGALDSNGYSDTVKTETEGIGFNVDWQVSETFNIRFDWHDSQAEAQPGNEVSDFIYIIAGPLGTNYSADYTGNGVPNVAVDDSSLFSNDGSGNLTPLPAGSTYNEPNFLRPNLGLERGNRVTNDVEQFQLDFKWDNASDSALKTISAGISNTVYEIDTAFRFRFFQFGTPNCGAPCSDLVNIQSSNRPGIFPTIAEFNAEDGLQGTIDLAVGNFFDTGLGIQEQHIIEEDTDALYVQFDFETDFNGMPFRTTAGVRYENTEVTGTSVQVVPDFMRSFSTTELRPIDSGETTDYTLSAEYTNWLPSLDTSLEIRDDIVARFSYGKSLARTDLNQMRPSLSISDARPGGPYNANQGNPGLLPYESDNIDVSFEWYYAENSYAAITWFKKWVDNYIQTSVDQTTIIGTGGFALTDPNPNADPTLTYPVDGGPNDQVITWDVISPDNAEQAEIDGLELSLQHFFGDSGFGVNANITFVDGDVEYDVNSVDQTVSLTGLSDSYNLVAFYEKGRIQARIAYNWRDEFLSETNQLRQTEEPVFVEEYGQLDASFNYDINDNLTVFIEGSNLTEEEAEAHGRFKNHFIYNAEQSARYSLGIRGTF